MTGSADAPGGARPGAPSERLPAPARELSGRVALVTGAARRTGRGLALALAARGAEVAVHYRSRAAAAAAVVEEIGAGGGSAFAVPADLRDPAAVQEMVRAVTARAGRVDILINNVGTFLVRGIDEVSPAEWKHSLDTTVTAAFFTCRAVVPGMAARGWGRIVNFADAGADHLRAAPNITAVRCAPPNITPYMVGKTGVLILTKSLAVHYAGRGITVNAVSPGIIENSVTKPPGGEQAIPAGRFATVADIANAVLFLVGDASAYITGANLKVGGGWHA